MLEAWLKSTTDPLINTAIARRLLATLRQAHRENDAAFALLWADLSPRDHTPRPGDFGTDPAADWPTDFPQDS
jgi:predicted metal-dependent HD superfamily phosphohydrolase